jgi:hypothetical protein
MDALRIQQQRSLAVSFQSLAETEASTEGLKSETQRMNPSSDFTNGFGFGKSKPQGLKARIGWRLQAARLKPCPSQDHF